MSRVQIKNTSVDRTEVVKVHCALSRLIAASGLKGRVSASSLQNWCGKVNFKAKRAFKAWIVPANAHELTMLPLKSFLDPLAVILPAGTSLENAVLVHIGVPESDLPYMRVRRAIGIIVKPRAADDQSRNKPVS